MLQPYAPTGTNSSDDELSPVIFKFIMVHRIWYHGMACWYDCWTCYLVGGNCLKCKMAEWCYVEPKYY